MFNEDFHSKCSVLEEEKTQWSFIFCGGYFCMPGIAKMYHSQTGI